MILCRSELAPGGVPTMDVNDNAFFLNERIALETIASKLAPTGGARLLPEVDRPAGFFGVFEQHRIRIHHVGEIHL